MRTRTAHILLEILAALVLALAALAAVGAWRLAQGPISISFLKPYVLEALHDEQAGLTITVDDTVLTWAGWDRPLDIRATGVRALDSSNTAVASVPEVSFRLSFRALLAGLIAPTTIDLIGPHAILTRTAEGGFRLALGEPAAAGDGVFDRLLAALQAPPDPTRALGYLRRVSIMGARIDVDEGALGTGWSAPRADIVFAKGGAVMRIDAALDIDFGGSVSHFAAVGEYRPDDGRVTAQVRFNDLSPVAVASRFAPLKPLEAFQLPLDGTLTAELDVNGTVSAMTFDLHGGAGRLDLPGLWPGGLEVKSVGAKGRLTRPPDRLAIDELTADLGGPKLAFKGAATRLEDSIALDGELAVSQVPFDEARRLWPKGVSEETRDWITGNIERGRVSEAHANLSLRLPSAGGEPELKSLAGAFRIDGATIHYLRPLPPVVNVSGTGTFDTTRIDIAVADGALKRLRVGEGTIRFSHIERRIANTDIELVVRGPLRDALEILDHERLGFMRKLGIDVASVEGEAATRLVFSFPLAKELPFSGIKIKAAANMQGVALRKAVLGQDLTEGALVMRLDALGMDVSGKAKVAGNPSDIVWVENFAATDPVTRRYSLKTRLDDQGRAALGFKVAPFVTGPVAVDLSLSQPASGPSELQLRLGLDEATLALSDLDWSKPPGRAGEATAVITLDGGKARSVPSFAIEAGDLKANGRLTLAEDGRTLARVDIERFVQGTTDLHGAVIRRADGGYDVDLAGPGLVAASFLYGHEDAGADKPALPPVTVSVQFDKVWFRSGAPLEKVSGALRYNGDAWTDMAIDAALKPRGRIAFRLRPEGQGSRIELDADDAGEALRIFGIYENITGGKLSVTATRTGEPFAPWTGKLAMADFRAVKAPALAKLFTVASLTGIANLLGGQGILFSKLDMPFRHERGHMTIEKARAVGSEIGLTAEGDIDTNKEIIRVNGTLVPAYTINSVLGNIPILGTLLTGGEGSGIFAATYRLEGPFDDPVVRVNPLAALAPGFLRNLLDIIMSGGSPASTEPSEVPN